MAEYFLEYYKDKNGEKRLRCVDKSGNEAPPAYVYKGADGKGKPILVCKSLAVEGPCTSCLGKHNVFALVIRGEVRVLCVQCLGEYTGRFFSRILILLALLLPSFSDEIENGIREMEAHHVAEYFNVVIHTEYVNHKNKLVGWHEHFERVSIYEWVQKHGPFRDIEYKFGRETFKMGEDIWHIILVEYTDPF